MQAARAPSRDFFLPQSRAPVGNFSMCTWISLSSERGKQVREGVIEGDVTPKCPLSMLTLGGQGGGLFISSHCGHTRVSTYSRLLEAPGRCDLAKDQEAQSRGCGFRPAEVWASPVPTFHHDGWPGRMPRRDMQLGAPCPANLTLYRTFPQDSYSASEWELECGPFTQLLWGTPFHRAGLEPVNSCSPFLTCQGLQASTDTDQEPQATCWVSWSWAKQRERNQTQNRCAQWFLQVSAAS